MPKAKPLPPIDGTADLQNDDAAWLKKQSPESLIAGFNAWMDDYLVGPDGFERSERTAIAHALERSRREPSSYGRQCLGLLRDYCEGVANA